MPDLRPRTIPLIKKAGNRLLRRGPGELLTVLGDRIKEAVSSEDELVFFVKDDLDAAEPEDRTDLLLVEATPLHAADYARFIGTDSRSTFADRLSPGTSCFLVYAGDLPVHATWVTTAGAWMREIGRYFVPPARHAYTYESFTRPEARGKGAYPFALKGISRILSGRGVDRLWVGVEADNPPSLKAVSKAGFREAFRVRFGRRWTRFWLHGDAGEGAEMLRTRPPEHDPEEG